MSITREQVADLREGDVVEMSWPAEHGAQMSVRGPVVWKSRDVLTVGGYWLCQEDREPIQDAERRTLTVISRAPRPLYVNHPRTEPVPGDVMIPVHHDADDVATWSWCPLRSGVHRWRETHSDAWLAPEDMGDDLRLLVDGETGRCVP